MRLKLPVNHLPGGTISCAPPSDAYVLSFWIAALKAFVFDVFPSPTAPKSVKTALCFRQFIAGYSIFPPLSLWWLWLFRHSATLKVSIPKITIAEITCKHQQKKIKNQFICQPLIPFNKKEEMLINKGTKRRKHYIKTETQSCKTVFFVRFNSEPSPQEKQIWHPQWKT